MSPVRGNVILIQDKEDTTCIKEKQHFLIHSSALSSYNSIMNTGDSVQEKIPYTQ